MSPLLIGNPCCRNGQPLQPTMPVIWMTPYMDWYCSLTQWGRHHLALALKVRLLVLVYQHLIHHSGLLRTMIVDIILAAFQYGAV